MRTVVFAYNPGTLEELGGSRVQGYPGVYGEFQASLGYVRSCLKENTLSVGQLLAYALPWTGPRWDFPLTHEEGSLGPCEAPASTFSPCVGSQSCQTHEGWLFLAPMSSHLHAISLPSGQFQPRPLSYRIPSQGQGL